MSILVPENLCRLYSTCFVSGAELSNRARGDILRVASKQLAEHALHKLINDCVKSRDTYMGFQGQTLEIDVYVLSPDELHDIIAKAVAKGHEESRRWQLSSLTWESKG